MGRGKVYDSLSLQNLGLMGCLSPVFSEWGVLCSDISFSIFESYFHLSVLCFVMHEMHLLLCFVMNEIHLYLSCGYAQDASTSLMPLRYTHIFFL